MKQYYHVHLQKFVVKSLSLAFTDWIKESEIIIGVQAKSQPYLTNNSQHYKKLLLFAAHAHPESHPLLA